AVRTASHASWMRPAAEAFAAELQALAFAPPRSWVISNATGSASRDAARLKQALSRQIDHTVQWQAAMQALGERQPGCVLEIGPGTSLARLWCQAQPQIPVRSLDDFQHWRAAAAWVAAHAG
ncbi:MAG TPA: ACP S-malonyltransferase, partial [Ideonella sp.]|nr:ACP S-malonyltransferase [Ideonella sp.]